MKTVFQFLVVALACLVMSIPACAQQDAPVTLKVGDAAPPLAGGRWIKGEPVKSFEEGTLYVVEFWATWCGPCIGVIPHVTAMQHKYANNGVIFIGQNVWESDQSAVAPFVQNMGDKMDYRVVLDDTSGGGRGKMAETWMQAAGQNGIPCSFLIDKEGKIAWIGHPMQLEPVLKQVVAGTFDPAKAAAEKEARDQLYRRLQNAMRADDADEALKVVDEFEKAMPEMALRLLPMRFQMLLRKKDYDAAYKIGAEAVETIKDDPGTLNEIAWTIVDMEGLEKRDLDLAQKLAVRAVELTEHKDAAILDTYARVMFLRGDVHKAIELQTKAIEVADPRSQPMLRATLEIYQKHKPQEK